MTFKSTSIKEISKDKYKLTGNLTIHGITKPVTMDLWYRVTAENPMNKVTSAGFQLTGSLKRSDFGIGPKFLPTMIGDIVSIKADGEFIKNKILNPEKCIGPREQGKKIKVTWKCLIYCPLVLLKLAIRFFITLSSFRALVENSEPLITPMRKFRAGRFGWN
jgi:hypothetical protein